LRANKEIGSSLEANVALHVPEVSDKALFDSVDIAELFIASEASVEVGGTSPYVFGKRASGEKCLRCWRILQEVAAPRHLCNRCTAAVAASETVPA
jgi:isoleucyl-tRNA synthetase